MIRPARLGIAYNDQRCNILGNSVLIKIILIPAIHFLFSIILAGAGILAIFRNRMGVKEFSPTGKLLVSTSLGILYNAVQFALVLCMYRMFPVHAQFLLSIGKYAMDLLFLLFVCLAYRSEFLDLLKSFSSILSPRENTALLLFSLLLGVAAVLNFPHVHDSGQLMATNRMLQKGNDFLSAGRYGLGFSALCYFPAALCKNIPMGTLASGYKIFILLLAGLAVIYGIDKMALAHQATGKFLLFIIFLSSFFGLYGIMVLGKDSALSVLFSIVFIFSLFGRSRGQKTGESLAYLFGAIAVGMIAIPYLCIFCSIWVLLRLLPENISSHKMLLPASVLLLLCCGAMLLPVKLAIKANTHLQPQYGKYVYWFPTDGKTSFYQYYFFYEKFGYRNSALLIMSGLLGILLLPLARERFRDAAMRSTALFLPVATLGCLALAFLARNFLPARRAQPIPLTPFTTKRVWDLIKDIPQWYVQIICGIIFVLMLDALVRKIPLAHKARRAIFLWVSLAAAGVCLSANLSMVAALKDPAHFYSYGGNKNNPFALVLESIHRNPDVTHIFMQSGVAAFDMNWFFFDIQNYFPARKFRIIRDSDLEKWPSLFPPGTSLLVANHYSFSKWQALCKKQGVFSARQLVDFQKTDEGIYLVARK